MYIIWFFKFCQLCCPNFT